MARVRDALITALCTMLARCFRPFRGALDVPPDPAILVLKPCCLGDLLLATPAIAALRASYPSARITLATGAWSRPAVARNPHLSEVLDCGGLGRGGFTGLLGGWRFAWALRRHGFDVAIVLDRSPVASVLPFLAGIPVRAGVDSGGRGFSLTHPVSPSPPRHEAQLYLDVVGALGCRPAGSSLHFTPVEVDQVWAEATLPPKTPWIAVHPGGGVNPGGALLGKRWPVERYVAVVERLLQKGFSVALLGAAQDAPLAEAIGASLSGLRRDTTAEPQPRLLDLSGSTTFEQLGALLQRCKLFLGGDTGPMHLAAAVGTPVVAIYGPSKPEFYAPYTARGAVVYHGDQCGRCRFRGGLVAGCNSGYACMAAVAVDEVWEAVERMLELAPARPPRPPLSAHEGDASIKQIAFGGPA